MRFPQEGALAEESPCSSIHVLFAWHSQPPIKEGPERGAAGRHPWWGQKFTGLLKSRGAESRLFCDSKTNGSYYHVSTLYPHAVSLFRSFTLFVIAPTKFILILWAMSCLPLASRRIQGEPFGFFQFYTTCITISSATRPRDCVLFRVTYYSHAGISRNMPVALKSLSFLVILSWNFHPFPQEVLLAVQDAKVSLMSR